MVQKPVVDHLVCLHPNQFVTEGGEVEIWISVDREPMVYRAFHVSQNTFEEAKV